MNRKNNSGGSRPKLVRFADRIAQLDINPLNRTDFLGELKEGDSENSSGGVSNLYGLQESIEILRSDNGSCQQGQHLLKEQEDEETFLHRRIYQQLRSTYFESALKYWKSRNLSRDFKTCSDTLTPYVQSLPHLIHHLSEIIDALLNAIQIPNSLAREPAYHLLSILARVC